MPTLSKRIQREMKTVAGMIHSYCYGWHGEGDAVCHECGELSDYANERLLRCPFQAEKTTCAKCQVHCYSPGMRQRIKSVMRESGTLMFYRHPLLTARHFVDEWFQKT